MKLKEIQVKRGAMGLFVVKIIFETYRVSRWFCSIQEALDFIRKETI